jgi:5-methylthioadenosine/S-adenosylhomocysteine deaminase
MTTRFIADYVAPMDDAMSIHAPGFVDVDDGRVTAVGPLAAAPGLPDAAHVERVGGLLLPGLVNDHAHSPMTVLRGAGEGLPLDRWLKEVIWPRESRLSPPDVESGMIVGAAEMLRNGITTTNEMYFFPEAVAAGAALTGIRSVVGAAIIEGVDRLGTPDEQFAGALALRKARSDDDLMDIAFAPHSAYALGDDSLRRIAEAAVAEDVLIHIHLAETDSEGASITERTGRTVPEHLADLGVLDARVLAAHCVWLTDGDIALLAAHGVGVAHCPGSNGKIASGMAPVSAMRAAGIPVGASTDGPGSNNNLDLLEEARLALLYARLRERDAAALGIEDALRMVTSEAAMALGRTDIGALVPGAWADMARISLDRPEYEPIAAPQDVLSHLVWAGSSRDVTDVWVAGNRVVAGGEVTTIDLDDARHKVREIAKRIAG